MFLNSLRFDLVVCVIWGYEGCLNWISRYIYDGLYSVVLYIYVIINFGFKVYKFWFFWFFG